MMPDCHRSRTKEAKIHSQAEQTYLTFQISGISKKTKKTTAELV